MPRHMIPTPIFFAEKGVVEPAAVWGVDDHESVGRELPGEVADGELWIAQVLQKLAHDDQVVAVVAEGIGVRLDVAVKQFDAVFLCFGLNVRLELDVERDGFNVAAEGFLERGEAVHFAGADIDDGSDVEAGEGTPELPGISAEFLFVNRTVQMERGVFVNGVVGVWVERGDFGILRERMDVDVPALGAFDEIPGAWFAFVFNVGGTDNEAPVWILADEARSVVSRSCVRHFAAQIILSMIVR